jgi:hypothetical protein
VLVLPLDDLRKDPTSAMTRVWTFLDLEPCSISLEVWNSGNKASLSAPLNLLLGSPPPWLGRVFAFVPKKWRMQARSALQAMNTRKTKIPPMSDEARALLSERFAAQRLANVGPDLKAV